MGGGCTATGSSSCFVFTCCAGDQRVLEEERQRCVRRAVAAANLRCSYNRLGQSFLVGVYFKHSSNSCAVIHRATF